MRCKACDAIIPDDCDDPLHELCDKCYNVVVGVLEDALEEELDDAFVDIPGATLPLTESDPWDLT